MAKLILLLFYFATHSWAATVGVDYGDFILIEGAGPEIESGQLYYALDADKRKVALLRITKVNGGRAEAELVKGQALPGQVLAPRQPAPVSAVAVAPSAQESESSLRYKLGLGLSFFSIKGGESAKSDLGMTGAFLVEYPLKNWFIDFGPRFYQAGAKNETKGVEVVESLNYFGLPVTLGWGSQNAFRPKIGFMRAYLLSGKLKIEGSGLSESRSIKPRDSRFDDLIVAGFDMVFDSENSDVKFWLELTYNHGLTKDYWEGQGITPVARVSNAGYNLIAGASF